MFIIDGSGDLKHVWELSLDVIVDNEIEITAKQHDDNSRYLLITLTADGETVEIPSDYTPYLRGLKANGWGTLTAGSIENGKAYIELTDSALYAAGKLKADVAVEADGEIILSTMPFIIDVIETPYDGGDIPQSSDILSMIIREIGDSARTASENAARVLNARMDTFTHLSEGSTTGDAELTDGRIDAYGVEHPNIGGNIRSTQNELSKLFSPYKNIIKLQDGTWTGNGVTLTISDNEVMLNGTSGSGGYSFQNLLANSPVVEYGETYRASIWSNRTTQFLSSTNDFSVYLFYGGYSVYNEIARSDQTKAAFTPAGNSDDQRIRIFVPANKTYNNVSFSLMLEKGSNISSTYYSPNAKIFPETPYFLNDGSEQIGEAAINRSLRNLIKTAYGDGRISAPFNFNTTSGKLEYDNSHVNIIYHTYGNHYFSAGYNIASADIPTAAGSYHIVFNNRASALYIRGVNTTAAETDINLGVVYIDGNGINTIASSFIDAFCIDGVPYVDKWRELKINCIGDSLTYGYLPDGGRLAHPYPELLGKALSAAVVRNYGITGRCVSNHPGYDTHEPMRPIVTDYVNMDDDADMILFMGGTNDFGKSKSDAAYQLGTMGSTDISTFYGALDVLARGLIDKYKKARIVWMTFPQNQESTPTITDRAGNPQSVWNQAIRDVAQKYSFYLIDLWDSLGKCYYNCKMQDSDGNYIWSEDGTHFVQSAVTDRLVPLIAENIKMLF